MVVIQVKDKQGMRGASEKAAAAGAKGKSQVACGARAPRDSGEVRSSLRVRHSVEARFSLIKRRVKDKTLSAHANPFKNTARGNSHTLLEN